MADIAPESIVAISIAIIALIPSLLQWRKYRSEADAAHGDEADKISAAWQRLNAPLVERVTHLEQIVIKQQTEIEELSRGIDALIEQVIKLGAKPVYTRKSGKS